jgi:Tat protein secretion system quality control protein TatD with DNase activity
VQYVAEEIARLKEIPVQEVIDATHQNALDIYQLK